jgi:cytochrome c peroxidase
MGGLSFRLLPPSAPLAPVRSFSADTIAGEKATLNALHAQELLSGYLQNVLEKAVTDNAPEDTLKAFFLNARLLYKSWEWAAEFSKPSVARMINGAPVPEAEPVGYIDPGPGDPPPTYNVTNPEGFQVIETLLYPKYDMASREELLKRIKALESNVASYQLYFQKIHYLDEQVLDAAKQEVFRVSSLGLAGFDVPLCLHALPEAAQALEGVGIALGNFPPASARDSALALIDSALAYLARPSSFNQFDRAEFLLRYGNPIAASITRMQTNTRLKYNRLLRQESPTLFAEGAFDPDAYLPGPEYATTPQKILLGKQLFFDKRLSGPGTRSCATCHQPDKAFTDGLVRNIDILGTQPVDRNTPTLINAALQPALFYDLRATTLEEQARYVMMNPKEMHGSVALAAQRLAQDTLYWRLFHEAFPGHYASSGTASASASASDIDTTDLLNALGAYVRSLVNLNSRFDLYMRGDSKALSKQEVHGFNLFMGQAKCGTCHYMPLFNGVFPPAYDRIETEVIGVPGPAASTSTGRAAGTGTAAGASTSPAGPKGIAPDSIDEDTGIYGILPILFLRHSFKVPTVRNAARTAPYMHNGVYQTLEEVIDFYDKGGGKVDNQTLPTDSLHLSAQDKKDLIAFIKSLDSH